MVVHVTQEIIDESIRWVERGCLGYRSKNCPIARAANRVTKFRCGFDGEHLNIYEDCPENQQIYLGREALDFAYKFDNSEPVSPFSFEIPDEYCHLPV